MPACHTCIPIFGLFKSVQAPTCFNIEKHAMLQILDGWTYGILGKDDLPPVKKGGVRTLRIPPELAFGERGDGCSFGLAENCQVPPNTPVELTFLYKGTKCDTQPLRIRASGCLSRVACGTCGASMLLVRKQAYMTACVPAAASTLHPGQVCMPY